MKTSQNLWSCSTLLAALVAASALLPASVLAQQVYRIVGPDGKVTFSDQPPTDPKAKVLPGNSATAGAASSAALPFELRQAASKYPVTLYTSDNCGPCGGARALLMTRGIPFSEKTVSTQQDGQALQRISGESSLPFATIGTQQLKGFSDSEWSQFLDAAGYPRTSVLPPNYVRPAATPLVTLAAPAPATASENRPAVRPAAAPTAAPPPPTADNPAGIRF